MHVFLFCDRCPKYNRMSIQKEEGSNVLVFIVNPTAGNGYAARVAELIRDEMNAQALPHAIWYTSRPGESADLAVKAAQDPACSSIISVGGDGSAFDMVSMLNGCTKPIGFIPAGTGNDFAKTIGIPCQPLEALRFILQHEPRPVDVGFVNGRCFLNVSGVGFDVTVLDQTLALKQTMRGIVPYMIGLIRAIRHFQPVHVRYEVDGKAYDRSLLIMAVANGRYFGGGIPICPTAQVDDGYFDLVTVDSVPRWHIPFYLPGLMLGRIDRFGVTQHTRCRHLTIHSPGMRVQIDGEIHTVDDVEYIIKPGHMMLYW